MSENPYAPPAAEVNDLVIAPEVPEAILKKIKNAWIAGLISAAVTLIFTLLAMAGTSFLGFSGLELFDVALILGLSYGIYKKSRTCAVLMLAYFVLSKIFIVIETGQTNGLVMAVIFIYYYAHGIHGTFVYQKLMKQSV